MKNKFLIVMPFYNAQKWVSKSIKSVKLQNYDNFHCIVADDCSTDQSYEICKQAIGDDARFTLIRSETNLGPLGNAYEAAIKFGKSKDDIVVILDGDDFFYSPNTLQIISDTYDSNKCWMTYGSYINLSNKKIGKFSRKVPDRVIQENLFRNYEWCTSHLRSYKFGLLQKVNREDLLDENGVYIRAAGDLALMFPLLEMSAERSQFVKDILYIWNDLNEMNEHKTKRELQIKSELYIRNMTRYNRIKELV
jgi:glycosyltransferase involved in cell wall biosynthesis